MSNKTDIHELEMELWSQFLQVALHNESRWTQVGFVVILCVIFVISLIGNLITCIVIYYDSTMHTATNYYLFNLAISDLVVTFAILLQIHEHLSDSYTFGNLACKVHFFLVIALWNNGILIMTALAVERYIAIWYPLLLQSTPVWRRVMKIIVFIWIVAILQALPEVKTVQLTKTHKSSICFTVPTTTYARILNGVLALVSFVIPLTIMTFVYTMIAFKVNVMQVRASRANVFNHRDNRSRVNRLVALTLSFLVCWLPFFMMRVVIFACDFQQITRFSEWWGIGNKIVCLNSWCSIVVNPILFSLMSTKFRKALKTLWCKEIQSRQCTIRINPNPVRSWSAPNIFTVQINEP